MDGEKKKLPTDWKFSACEAWIKIDDLILPLDPGIGGAFPGNDFSKLEPDGDFYVWHFPPNRCMGQVAAHFEGKIVADRARRSLRGAGGAYGFGAQQPPLAVLPRPWPSKENW